MPARLSLTLSHDEACKNFKFGCKTIHYFERMLFQQEQNVFQNNPLPFIIMCMLLVKCLHRYGLVSFSN